MRHGFDSRRGGEEKKYAFNTMTKKSHSSLFLLTLVTAIGLIIGGFFVPPTGIIDGSVLTAVGELFAFGALAQLPHLISMGKEVHITRGDTSVIVGDGDDIAHLTRHGHHKAEQEAGDEL